MASGVSAKRDERSPTISQIWLRQWDTIIPLFGYPMEIRTSEAMPKAIVSYVTNAIE